MPPLKPELVLYYATSLLDESLSHLSFHFISLLYHLIEEDIDLLTEDIKSLIYNYTQKYTAVSYNDYQNSQFGQISYNDFLDFYINRYHQHYICTDETNILRSLLKKINEQNSKIYGLDTNTGNWHCMTCGTNMGPNNPRQLCGKYRCDGI